MTPLRRVRRSMAGTQYSETARRSFLSGRRDDFSVIACSRQVGGSFHEPRGGSRDSACGHIQPSALYIVDWDHGAVSAEGMAYVPLRAIGLIPHRVSANGAVLTCLEKPLSANP